VLPILFSVRIPLGYGPGCGECDSKLGTDSRHFSRSASIDSTVSVELLTRIRIFNMTTGIIYIRSTSNANDTVSAATGMPMMQGAAEVFAKGPATNLAIIAAVAAT